MKQWAHLVSFNTLNAFFSEHMKTDLNQQKFLCNCFTKCCISGWNMTYSFCLPCFFEEQYSCLLSLSCLLVEGKLVFQHTHFPPSKWCEIKLQGVITRHGWEEVQGFPEVISFATVTASTGRQVLLVTGMTEACLWFGK